jgi:hypothetical protein
VNIFPRHHFDSDQRLNHRGAITVKKKAKRKTSKADQRAMRELELRTAVGLMLASPVLTVHDASTFARISAAEVRRLCASGALEYVNEMGKSWLVNRVSLEKFLTSKAASDSDAKRERREREARKSAENA